MQERIAWLCAITSDTRPPTPIAPQDMLEEPTSDPDIVHLVPGEGIQHVPVELMCLPSCTGPKKKRKAEMFDQDQRVWRFKSDHDRVSIDNEITIAAENELLDEDGALRIETGQDLRSALEFPSEVRISD